MKNCIINLSIVEIMVLGSRINRRNRQFFPLCRDFKGLILISLHWGRKMIVTLGFEEMVTTDSIFQPK